jgi:uncharacterized lipoprotein YmbA
MVACTERDWKDRMVETLRRRVQEIDENLSEQISINMGNFLPAFAVAAALIDAGVVDRGRLLTIVDRLHDVATGYANVGDADLELDALNRMRLYLETIPLSEGTVPEVLERQAGIGLLSFPFPGVAGKRK